MAPHSLEPVPTAPRWVVVHNNVELNTKESQQFIDVTDWVARNVRRSGIADGLVTVQSLHTTAAVLINENEPLLLGDLGSVLAHWAPDHGGYRHDDLDQRTANLTPDERPNGHAHARAMALQASVTLAVVEGRVQLGRWQRLFLAELDGPRRRGLIATVVGLIGPSVRERSTLRPVSA